MTGVIARTFIGPKDAKTGEPREKERTAAFAKNAPTRVLVIACLFDLADFDKVVKPVLRSPARKDFMAEPAFVCSKRAKAAPVSITFIPKLRDLFRGLALRRRTMCVGISVCYINVKAISAGALSGLPTVRSCHNKRTFPPWEGFVDGILDCHIPNNHGKYRKPLKVRRLPAPYLQRATLCPYSSPGTYLSNRTTCGPY
jgi:hypothetical protein